MKLTGIPARRQNCFGRIKARSKGIVNQLPGSFEQAILVAGDKEAAVRIRIIAPITNPQFAEAAQRVYAERARPDVGISAVSLEEGPASIESIYEDSLAVPQVVEPHLL